MRAPDLELPHRLTHWKAQHGAIVRRVYPELESLVRQIQQLQAERAAMRADPTFVPPTSSYKRMPLPKGLTQAERAAEYTRRAVASMRALRQRRREEANLDLVAIDGQPVIL
jgi:hypothetical protein